MRLRQRLPYIVVMAAAAAAEIATAVLTMVLDADRPWWSAASSVLLGVVLGSGAILLYVEKPNPFVPFWARPFEILKTARGVIVRCTDCDDVVVVGSAAPLPVPRVLTYIHTHHDSDNCRERQRDRAAASREGTAAIAKEPTDG